MTPGPISFRDGLPVSGFSTRHSAALPSCHSTLVGVLRTAVPTQGYGITEATTVAAGILTTVRPPVGTEVSLVQAQLPVRAVAQVRGGQVQVVDWAWEAAQAPEAAVASVPNLHLTQHHRFDNLTKCLLAE